jgi:hypothetical protein
MRNRSMLWLWPLTAAERFKSAVRQYWRRILVGAFVGWVFAVVGGAFGLASLEFWGLVSQQTSDSLGIAAVFTGIWLGALVAYADRTPVTDRVV